VEQHEAAFRAQSHGKLRARTHTRGHVHPIGLRCSSGGRCSLDPVRTGPAPFLWLWLLLASCCVVGGGGCGRDNCRIRRGGGGSARGAHDVSGRVHARHFLVGAVPHTAVLFVCCKSCKLRLERKLWRRTEESHKERAIS